MPKVLVIDDSPVMRNLLCDFLIDNGYDVDTAEDGLAGIKAAVGGDYQLVICDMHMPKRNGFQVYGEVSAERPEIEFIMTDSMPGDLVDEAQESGLEYFLAKPFDLDQLREMLDQILQKTEISQ